MKELKPKLSLIYFILFKSKHLRFWQTIYAWSKASTIEVNGRDVFYTERRA